MSNDSKTFIVEVEYFNGSNRYYTADVRQDARDFAKAERKKKSVFCTRLRPAKRCPSNVRV